MSNAEKFYSEYLWAYTLSVSGGAVSFTVDDGEPEKYGWPYVHAYQRAVLLGAVDGRASHCIYVPGVTPLSDMQTIAMLPKTFEEFTACMGDIPPAAEPPSPPAAPG